MVRLKKDGERLEYNKSLGHAYFENISRFHFFLYSQKICCQSVTTYSQIFEQDKSLNTATR